MGVFSFIYDHLRSFENIIVHPSQDMLHPSVTIFRGGPQWPLFEAQVFARHCWGVIPKPVDSKPYPVDPERPYFQAPTTACRRWRALPRPGDGKPAPLDCSVESADTGIWCGPITDHFGHMIATFGMRIAASSRVDAGTPLVFSIWPFVDAAPVPFFFWEIIDHFGIDRRRVMLVGKPTRFARLSVLPQAERRFGGGPSRHHLRMMDAITASSAPAERDLLCVFVSRARLPKGRFAGEAYLDRTLAAAGVTVFHPETVDLHAQLQLYRRARRLIFSQGSALHALQLLGHLDAEIVVLTRRRRGRIAHASLRPRVQRLRYLRAVRGLVYGLLPSGDPQSAAAISVLDEQRCIAGFAALGIDLAPHWDPKLYAEQRDADIAAWMADRLATAAHPGERAMIENCLQALSLRP